MERVERTPMIAAAAAGFAAWISVGSISVADLSTGARVGFLPPLWLAPILIAGAVVAARTLRLSRHMSLPEGLALCCNTANRGLALHGDRLSWRRSCVGNTKHYRTMSQITVFLHRARQLVAIVMASPFM